MYQDTFYSVIKILIDFQEIYRVANIHKSVVTDLAFAPQDKRTDDHEFSLFSICPDHDIRIHESNPRGKKIGHNFVMFILVHKYSIKQHTLQTTLSNVI